MNAIKKSNNNFVFVLPEKASCVALLTYLPTYLPTYVDCTELIASRIAARLGAAAEGVYLYVCHHFVLAYNRLSCTITHAICITYAGLRLPLNMYTHIAKCTHRYINVCNNIAATKYVRNKENVGYSTIPKVTYMQFHSSIN